jgi:hypothetical protein
MFVFNEIKLDVLFVTIDYCSVLVISFIFYMTGIFLTEQNEIAWQ